METSFGVRQGLYNKLVPDFVGPLGDTRDLSLWGAIESADLAFKFTDFFGVAANFNAVALLGANAPSMILNGGNFGGSGSIGPVLRILRSEATGTQVSLRANLGYGTGNDFTPTRILTEVGDLARNQTALQATRTLLNADFANLANVSTSTTSYGGSIHLAQSLGTAIKGWGKNIGFQAALLFDHDSAIRKSFDLTAGSDVNEDTAVNTLTLPISATLDAAGWGVPIAGILEYAVSATWYKSTPMDSFDGLPLRHVFGAGVYYTGRRDLEVGILAAHSRTLQPVNNPDGAPSGKPTATYAQFMIRYHW